KLEMRFLTLETEIAHKGGEWSLARAYLDETAQREPANCEIARYVHESRAEMAYEELDAAAARRELGAVETCADGRYTIVGALTLARVAASEAEKTELRKAVAALRARSATLRPGERALVEYLDGIASGDRTLFRIAIAAASSLPRSDADAAKARSHAYAALLADAARAGDFGAVVAFAAEARGIAAAPTRCALALAAQADRTMVGGRGADGAPFGAFGRRTTTAIDAARLVSPAAVAAIARCETVDVLAMPPLEGVA